MEIPRIAIIQGPSRKHINLITKKCTKFTYEGYMEELKEYMQNLTKMNPTWLPSSHGNHKTV